MSKVNPGVVILAIIALALAGTGIEIAQQGFIDARNLTNASANFTSGLDITDLLMGLVGAFVVLALFVGGVAAARSGTRRRR